MSTPAVPDDVFLSHSSPDKPAVEQLARRLLEAGIRPWLDSWNLIPGDPWQEGLEDALDSCTTCAVFLGPSGIGPWHNEELRVALDRRARDPTRTFRVIPILLPGANPADPSTLPRFLSRMTWVDFRAGLDEANAFNRLLAGIRGVAPGPGHGFLPEPAAQASSVTPPTGTLTAGQRQRLEGELTRLQIQLETHTRRLAALDTDISRELDSERKLILQDRRADLVNERNSVAEEMTGIEQVLAETGVKPADASEDEWANRKRPAAESHPGVVAGERGVAIGGVHNGPIFTGDISGGVHVEVVASSSEIIPPAERKHLPDTTGLVGRQTEMEYYLRKIEVSGLAVITGMPGVGKTALAVMLARRIAAPDKIFWHAFLKDEGADALIWDLARFLALKGHDTPWRILQGAHRPPETLLDYLVPPARGHGYVLCLDDFQFVDHDPLLVQLVGLIRSAAQAGGLRLIITSRHSPAFVQSGEYRPLAGLARSDADNFLHARGLALGKDLQDTLYERTEGNAHLLIMAVDALKRSSDPARLVHHLEESDDIEIYLMNQVYEGLSAVDQAVMGAVSVLMGFPGTRGTIEAILDGKNMKLHLRELVDRHLVIQSGEPAVRRYSQHAIVQAFYYELLAEAERDQMHVRVGRYYEHKEPNMLQAALHYERGGEVGHATDLATTHARSIMNQGQARQLQLLLERLSDQPLSPIQRVSVGIAKGDVYRLLGQADLAKKNYEEAFNQLSTLSEGSDRTALRAKACVGMADLLEYSAPAEAVEWIEKGLHDGDDEHPLEMAALYVKLSGAHFALTNHAKALDAAERARQILGDTPSPLLAQLLINLGNLSAARGDLAKASEYTKRSLAVSQDLGDFHGMLSALSNGGVDKFIAGDTAGAIADLQEALVLAENLGSLRAQARLQVNLGVAYVRTGADDLASEALQQGGELARQSGALEYVIAGLLGQAELHTRQGELESAESALAAAEVLAQRMQALDQLIEIWRRWAEIHLVRNDLAAGLGRAQQALDLARSRDLAAEEGMCLRVMGQVLWASGDRDGALTAFTASLALLDGCDPYEAACTRMVWGSALLSGTGPQDGRALLQEARAVFEATGAQPRLAAVAEVLDD